MVYFFAFLSSFLTYINLYIYHHHYYQVLFILVKVCLFLHQLASVPTIWILCWFFCCCSFIHVVFWSESAFQNGMCQLTRLHPNSWQPTEDSDLLPSHTIVTCSSVLWAKISEEMNKACTGTHHLSMPEESNKVNNSDWARKV